MAYDASKDETLATLGTKMFGTKEKGCKLIVTVQSYDGGAPKLGLRYRFYPTKREGAPGRLSMEETIALASILADSEADLAKYKLQADKLAKAKEKGGSEKPEKSDKASKSKPTEKPKAKKADPHSKFKKGLRNEAAGDEEE